MRRPSVLVALPLVAGVGLVAAWPALAADPSPSAALGTDLGTEVWQDVPLPSDTPAGDKIEVGFTIWDVRRGTLSEVNSAKVRVHPKSGKAKPTESTTRSDWSGHVIAPITVPKGGLGTIEIGFPAQECHDDGTCVELFLPFAWGGVGPPPAAPRSLLVNATINRPAAAVVAHEPFDVDVDIEPRADWDRAALALPTTVVLIGNRVNGNSSVQTDMRLVSDGHYTATMTLDEPGDNVLTVGFQTDAGELDIIDRAALRLRVAGGPDAEATPAASRGSSPASPSAPAGDGPPILPLALGGIGLVALALVVRRAFADL